jgi:hypothetical protein
MMNVMWALRERKKCHTQARETVKSVEKKKR